jgi:hypothetical protein
MRTSLIVRLDLEAAVAESLNSVYRLGPHLDALAEDEHGNPMFVSLGGVSALRSVGTNAWHLARAQQLLRLLQAEDVVDVIRELLDIALPPGTGADDAFKRTRH